MEIKDLATAVELGAEMADVRGGWGGLRIGNVRVRDPYTESYSSIHNDGIDAPMNVNVSGSQFNGGGLGDIVSAPTNSVQNNVSQTTTSSISNAQSFDGLNFSAGFPFVL